MPRKYLVDYQRDLIACNQRLEQLQQERRLHLTELPTAQNQIYAKQIEIDAKQREIDVATIQLRDQLIQLKRDKRQLQVERKNLENGLKDIETEVRYLPKRIQFIQGKIRELQNSVNTMPRTEVATRANEIMGQTPLPPEPQSRVAGAVAPDE